MSAPALVLLAAGASRRLGQCKALVDLAGSPPLERLHRAGGCFDAHRHLVVTGADDEAIRAAAPAAVEIVTNTEWSRGRATSVRCAIRARPGLDLVLAPVDVPLVEAQVFERLLASWVQAAAPPAGWLAPRWPASGAEVRFGHPVVIGRGLAERIAASSRDRPLREARAWAEPVWSVPGVSASVLQDLDTPEDLQRLRSQARPIGPRRR